MSGRAGGLAGQRWSAAESTATTYAAAGVAAVGALAALARYGLSARGIVASCLLGVLGAVAVIDLRARVVPVRIVLPATAVILTLQLAFFGDHALEWVLASLLAFAGLAALWAVKRDGISLTDAPLGLLLGAGLGADAAVAMLVASLALWPVAAYLFWRDGADARKADVPLAPAMALGAALTVLAG